MVAVVKTYRKHAAERRRLLLNYGCFLETTETLVDFQATVTPYTEDAPIVLNVAYPDVDHKKLTMFASGGVANTNYVIRLVVRTDQGQVKADDIGLRVVA